jgi:hypothetical protein
MCGDGGRGRVGRGRGSDAGGVEKALFSVLIQGTSLFIIWLCSIQGTEVLTALVTTTRANGQTEQISRSQDEFQCTDLAVELIKFYIGFLTELRRK